MYCEVQHKRAENQFEVLLCDWCTDDGATLEAARLCLAPGPWSWCPAWGCTPGQGELGLWHNCLACKKHFEGILRQGCGARQAWPSRLTSMSSRATQHGWAATSAASAAHGHSITSPGTTNCW